MNIKSINVIVDKLIDEAIKLSKKQFLKYTKSIYGTKQDVWKHLWDVPIVTSYNADVIFPAKLTTMSRDEILQVIDLCVEKELGDAEAVFIPYDNIVCELDFEAATEYEQGVANGTIPQEYDAVIVYNEARLKKDFKELLQEAKKLDASTAWEKAKKTFLKLTTETFLHEILHINANSLLITSYGLDLYFHEDYSKEKFYVLNGMELKDENVSNDNEVLIDTMAKIISIFELGDTVEDCLYKVIMNRGNKSSYEEIDDREILTIYTLFPDEVARWIIFEAYEEQHANLIAKKQEEVFGKEGGIYKKLSLSNIYFNEHIAKSITKEQLAKRLEMLEMIGVQNI